MLKLIKNIIQSKKEKKKREKEMLREIVNIAYRNINDLYQKYEKCVSYAEVKDEVESIINKGIRNSKDLKNVYRTLIRIESEKKFKKLNETNGCDCSALSSILQLN